MHTSAYRGIKKPRSKNGRGISFPFIVEANGRTGRIKKWGDRKFGTYFVFAGKKFRNSFRTFEAAFEYLQKEFSKLDTDRANSLALHPINHEVKTYHELEQILREQGNGASLREAVEFYLAHQENKKFSPKSVEKCIEAFLAHEENLNHSPSHMTTLRRHLGHFEADFDPRKIHTISSDEISRWLSDFRTTDGKPWSVKTRKITRGSLVSLSLYSRDSLNAIPDLLRTSFQKVKNAQKDEKGPVEIYTADQMRKLLSTALANDVDLIPALVLCGFEGLRPDEFHAENVDRAKRLPLTWESLNWDDELLHVYGQKVRSLSHRDVPLHPVAQRWLRPFKSRTGAIWRWKKSFARRFNKLHAKAKLDRVIYDGLRHSYASYRIRHLKGDLDDVAQEMGNSKEKLVSNYKRNVTDKEADQWFSVMPPKGYAAKIKAVLALSQAG